MFQHYHIIPMTNRATGPRYAWAIRLFLTLLLILAVAPSILPLRSMQAAGVYDSGLTTQLDTYLAGLAAQSEFSGAVLVARHGTILLSKGYGMADRARHIPNTPDTRYPVGGVSSNMSLVGALWLEEHGMLPDRAPICHYLAACPVAWKPITIHMVLDGSANLPHIDWPGTSGTTAHSLKVLQAEPLDGTPGARFDFQNGDTLVLAAIIEKAAGVPWATFLQQTIYGPAGMRRSGRMTDASTPPGWAQDYSGPTADSNHNYSSFYVVASTAADIYAYDNALFGGHLLSPRMLTRMFTPLATTFADNSSYMDGLTDERTCYQAWTSGRALGHAVLFTKNGARSFQTINMRFPHDQATIVVISNDDHNDVDGIARRLVALMFGKAVATPSAHSTVRVIAPAKAVLATYANTGGGWPFALTPGALWAPTASANGEYNYVTRVDTKTGRVVATITVSKLPNDGAQDSVVVADGQIWAIDHAAKAVVRIDPATNRVVTTIPIGMIASQLAVGGTTLWASSGNPAPGPDRVVRVDLRTRKVVAVLTHVGHPYLDTAATPDAFWYISQDTLRVMRLDAATDKVVAAISAGPVPQTVFVGAGSVWVGDASGALLTRIDPRTNKVIAAISTDGYPGNRRPAIDDCACRYAVGDGSVWAIANSTTLVRIDPQTNRVVASLTLSDRLGSIALGEGSIWISSDGANPTPTLYRVDPQAMT